MVKTKFAYRKTRLKRLTLAFVRASLSYDKTTGLFRWKHRKDVPIYINTRDAGNIAGRVNAGGYIMIGLGGHLLYAHRLAWFYVKGVWPERIDHRNTFRSDNRWRNLRAATQSQNAWNANRCKSNKTGFKGVQFRGKPYKRQYIARIKAGDKQTYLGCFYTAEEAYKAYCKAANRLHGKFARHA